MLRYVSYPKERSHRNPWIASRALCSKWTPLELNVDGRALMHGFISWVKGLAAMEAKLSAERLNNKAVRNGSLVYYYCVLACGTEESNSSPWQQSFLSNKAIGWCFLDTKNFERLCGELIRENHTEPHCSRESLAGGPPHNANF